jgi:hypothetical protein
LKEKQLYEIGIRGLLFVHLASYAKKIAEKIHLPPPTMYVVLNASIYEEFSHDIDFGAYILERKSST